MCRLHLTYPTPGLLLHQHTTTQNSYNATMDTGNRQQLQDDWLHLRRSESDDFTQPLTVTCHWTITGEHDQDIAIQAAENPSFEGELLTYYGQATDDGIPIHSLKANAIYYLRALGHAQGHPICSDPVMVQTAHEVPRWILVRGVSNVRDIGGWKTTDGRTIRQGLLYRGGELNSHMRATPEALRFLEESLGIRCILDLREDEEIALAGTGSPLSPKVRWIHRPLAPYACIGAKDQMERYADILRLFLAPENRPMYVHCWGGADRTGTLIFMLCALLGMTPSALLADYELTNLSIWGNRSRLSPLFTQFENLLETLIPGGSYEEKALAYFTQAGITEEEIRRFRETLLS